MKTFGTYFSKHLTSFVCFMIVLIFINIMCFTATFFKLIVSDYGATSPAKMLEQVNATLTANGPSHTMIECLSKENIWAMFIKEDGNLLWSTNLPSEIPTHYTLQDIALFSKGYLIDYPVFIYTSEQGLLVLGYPKDSYTKLTSNYYSITSIKRLPIYLSIMLTIDFLLLFFAYYVSKQKIIKNTTPILNAIDDLSNGKSTTLTITGDLSEVAKRINKLSKVLSQQNTARANWISGVSHDIRTPLSMIMGYADRITSNDNINEDIKEQANIILHQSEKVKKLIEDLNLVSQLDYEMQPLHTQTINLSKFLRTYVAELFNTSLPSYYDIQIDIPDYPILITGDPRLINRGISNLVNNCMQHNPNGCTITFILTCISHTIQLIIADNGIGVSPEKLLELHHKPHYMTSTDDNLQLRHGLGLILVHQIMAAHNSSFHIESELNKGFKAILTFQQVASNNKVLS